MLIRIDGRLGEGGGQILRSSLSLSLVTGKAFRIENIRAGREKPGLLRQHLAAVLAAAEVSGGEVEGAEPGSSGLTFRPGPVRPGDYRFSVGTAGSATLVFQTVLPALMLASGPSSVEVEGGTHNMAAPPYDFLSRTFVPLVNRMGPNVRLRFGRYGFYPAGGGRFSAEIEPASALTPLHLGERGEITSRRVIAVVANLQRHIAEREVSTASSLLGWDDEPHLIEATRQSAGPGNVAMIEIGSSEVTALFTAFGRIGVSAEMVARSAAAEAREYMASKAVACEHLADQLLLPMALAGTGSFTAVRVSEHARTNMEVIGRFLPIRFETHEQEGFTRIDTVTTVST
jgi:RNA 3'-terminal phosphate cyclase (ATP)